MVHPLVGIHAVFGELGVFAFLWVFVELLNPTEKRVRRAKIAAFVGFIMLFLSWITGGFYYVSFYGVAVKPLIKAGPVPWAHAIFTEVKEHVFLFLPFLSVLTLGLIHKYDRVLTQSKKIRNAVLMISGLVILIGFAMAGMGYVISTGARVALEAGL